MALEPLYLMRYLRTDFSKEPGRGGIHRTGEHKVVPYHQPQRIADIVKSIRLEFAATPEAYHIHIGIPGGDQQLAIAIGGVLAFVRIAGYPVGTL